MKRIAVAIVHGIDIYDPDFAATPAKLLRQEFARAFDGDAPDPEDALVVEPIHWAPELEGRQRLLFERMFSAEREDSEAYFDKHLSATIRELNAGKMTAMAPLLASLVRPSAGGLHSLHYPTARWIMLHFVGDVVAYQGREAYRAIHQTFANGLAALARRAGADAPLCVMAHSFGTMLASDYFYDRQQTALAKRTDLTPSELETAMGPSPLARGETLAWMYTMGSPLALWSLRYEKGQLDAPIEFPGLGLAERYPEVDTEWVNLYEKDDIIAYPLRPLSDSYARVVKEDRAVAVKGLPISMTPLIHPFYWADKNVIRPLARSLAAGWRAIN